MELEQACRLAAEVILDADALLIGAGAGMGVDSGLPDFRGPEGFWRAYPAFRGRRFEEVSNPVWFQRDPEQAWGFFGHRLNLYRATAPHAGFRNPAPLGRGPPAGLLRLHQQRRRAFPSCRLLARSHPGVPRLDQLPAVRARVVRTRSGRRRIQRSWSMRTRSVPGRLCRSASVAASWPGPTCSCSATGAGFRTVPKNNRQRYQRLAGAACGQAAGNHRVGGRHGRAHGAAGNVRARRDS